MPVSIDMMDGGVALVTLSPEASADTFAPANFEPFLSTLNEVMIDPLCRSVVIAGSGRFFSAGGNIDDFADGIETGEIGDRVQEMTDKLHPLLLRMRTSEKVFVCAINGSVAGGGLGLALASDYRVCVPRAKLASAFFRLGLSPDGGMTWLLPRLVGNQTAKRFLFNSEVWSGEKAMEVGAVDELVDESILVERSLEVAREWGKWSVNSRRGTKQLLDASTSTFFETQLQFEQSLMVASSKTADFAEGVRSFKEKREPSFGVEEEE
ncbi:MAG: enoyl-CoA hydratase/isomerase family protein [Candidatus Thalassarchaeaceae archaeon]|tara:strand:+ start:1386 stop:2183 length:798 start_codon:yes stop_codon:yes gene_type:complete